MVDISQIERLLAAVDAWGSDTAAAGESKLAVKQRGRFVHCAFVLPKEGKSICAVAASGELVAHRVDWIAVAEEMRAEMLYSPPNQSSFISRKSKCTAERCVHVQAPSPLRCLRRWRQV